MKPGSARRPWPARVALALALIGLLPLGHAGYLETKARLAQVLLERAWQQARIDHVAAPPWPWADTTPIARLYLARLGIDQIVLSGDSGRTLAFGPGWAPSSAPPGTLGLSVISAHRDTHFSFLRSVVRDDEIAIDTTHGISRYHVIDTQVVDSRADIAPRPTTQDGLLLVTCYPFDAIVPGGSLRFVVSAIADESVMKRPQPVSTSSSNTQGNGLAVR